MPEEQPIADNEKTVSLDTPTVTSGAGFGGALELPAGRIIAERYRVVEELGRGGMGVVYRVEQIALGRDMALKTIDGHEIKDATWRRFQQEAKASSLLDHPNLISVHDSGMIDGRHPYFVMDLVQGTTLAKLVEEKGPLSVEEALPIFIQVCFGLAYAHDLGIVHRDLKPSNIMLSKPPGGGAMTVRIVDFGIAKLRLNEGADVQGLTKTGEIFGSPLYMSPEQCLGIAVDHRSDIYALGCCFFEALAGLPPFMGNTALSTMMQHQSEKPPSLKEATLGREFPQDIETLISRLLEKDPDKRYQSLKMLAKDLSLLQQGISSQSLTFTPGIMPKIVSRGKTTSVSNTVKACILTAIISGTGIWFAKDQLDAGFYSKKFDAEMAKFKEKAASYEPFTGSKETVQSTIVVSKKGHKMRRLYFVRAIGQFNVVGDANVLKAAGIHEIPIEKSIHLRITDTECLAQPNFFLQFQPGDITELTIVDNIGGDTNSLKNISHLHNIDYLNLTGDEVDDGIIDCLNQLPVLTKLYIGSTQITEKGILSLKRLKNLSDLSLSGLPSASKVINELKNSSVIRMLLLDRCGVTEEDAKTIATMKNIVELDLKENKAFDDKAFKELASLKNLERLDISDTSVTTASIDVLKTFHRLNRLGIRINQWTQADIMRAHKANPTIELPLTIKAKDDLKTQL